VWEGAEEVVQAAYDRKLPWARREPYTLVAAAKGSSVESNEVHKRKKKS
jgi:hypothetical protein